MRENKINVLKMEKTQNRNQVKNHSEIDDSIIYHCIGNGRL